MALQQAIHSDRCQNYWQFKRVGDHVCIGANAVVLIDIPAGKNATGVPAVIIERD